MRLKELQYGNKTFYYMEDRYCGPQLEFVELPDGELDHETIGYSNEFQEAYDDMKTEQKLDHENKR